MYAARFGRADMRSNQALSKGVESRRSEMILSWISGHAPQQQLLSYSESFQQHLSDRNGRTDEIEQAIVSDGNARSNQVVATISAKNALKCIQLATVTCSCSIIHHTSSSSTAPKSIDNSYVRVPIGAFRLAE